MVIRQPSRRLNPACGSMLRSNCKGPHQTSATAECPPVEYPPPVAVRGICATGWIRRLLPHLPASPSTAQCDPRSAGVKNTKPSAGKRITLSQPDQCAGGLSIGIAVPLKSVSTGSERLPDPVNWNRSPVGVVGLRVRGRLPLVSATP